MELKENNIVVCGGTFDHFHKGHRDFLSVVFKEGKKAIIGVASDELISKSAKTGKEEIEPYETRKKSVEEFVKSSGREDEVVELSDMFGPTLNISATSKLVVSELTKKGADLINDKRKEKGFDELSVIIVPLTKAEDGVLISSTRIRNGEITREGKMTVAASWYQRSRFLPLNLRSELAKPRGPFIGNIQEWRSRNDPSRVILVGDVTVEAFNKENFQQKLSVVDFHVARKQKHTGVKDLGFSDGVKTIFLVNHSGSLNPAIFAAADEFFKSKNQPQTVFVINGEEDLVVLPFLLRAPLGFTIVYGQPEEGMIEIVVTEEEKKRAYNLVSGFTDTTV